ncbi:MAG: hypothetical protein M3O90_01200 [Actinomycetota bacterium]|nr:hypothetical protein [Actinomycetota bacterium]
MADRILFLSWGAPVRGREERGLEVFNEALGMLGRKQQDGQIESFDVCLLAPNASVNGYVQIRGMAEQINALREDPEFQRSTLDASLIVENLQHIVGYCNEGIAAQMALYQEAIGKVPQLH